MQENPNTLAKMSKQRNEIASLTLELEKQKATKSEHVFRLRKILIAALDDHTGWRNQAKHEVGRGA